MTALAHFYYGQVMQQGQPTTESQLLARSKGLNQEAIRAALRYAQNPPLTDTVGIGWGVLRGGRGLPMILSRAEQNAGAIVRHIILIPTEQIKTLAGNLAPLQALVKRPIPTFEAPKGTIAPLKLSNADVPSRDDQIDNLLELLSIVQNRTKTIDPLISAVISGTVLTVKNAPQDIAERMNFVQGLQMLLPASTRFGVTYLFHANPDMLSRVQIAFMDQPPPQTTIFDWESGEVTGNIAQADYGRFIVSQLRLDVEQAINQAEALTSIAGWRFSSGDNLAEALDYASRRISMDRSIQNNMPIEMETAANILNEDPTLTDDMRVSYARHLLSFSLALSDVSQINSITAIISNNPNFEREVYQSLRNGIREGKSDLVFEILVNWLDDPLSPQGPSWLNLTNTAALETLDTLVAKRDIKALALFLDRIQSLGTAARQMIPQVLEKIMPVAVTNRAIASRVVLFGMQHLTPQALDELLTSQLARQLPEYMQQFLGATTHSEIIPERGLLIRAANSVGKTERTTAALQLAKLANQRLRLDLIDGPTLQELTKLTTSQIVDKAAVSDIAQAVTLNRLHEMDAQEARALMQLALAAEDYRLLARNMVAQSRDIYGADHQTQFLEAVQTVFAKTPLTPAAAQQALTELPHHNISDAPLLAATCGTLQGTKWSTAMRGEADFIMEELFHDPRYLEILPSSCLMTLLRYYGRQNDMNTMRVIATLLGTNNAHKPSKQGLADTTEAYQTLRKNKRTRTFALEVIRQYIRSSKESSAQQALQYYGRRLGESTGNRLEFSATYSKFMGRVNLLTYAHDMRITVSILQNLADLYHAEATPPELYPLRKIVSDLRSDLTPLNVREIAKAMRKISSSIVELGTANKRHSSNNDRYLQALVDGSQEPRSVLDIFRASGGYLLQKQSYPLRLGVNDSIEIFNNDDPETLVTHMVIASHVLEAALTPQIDRRNPWSYALISDELRSLSLALPDAAARDTVQQLGRDWQRAADLIWLFFNQGNIAVVDDRDKRGQQLARHEVEPKTSLELLRFYYGFFLGSGKSGLDV